MKIEFIRTDGTVTIDDDPGGMFAIYREPHRWPGHVIRYRREYRVVRKSPWAAKITDVPAIVPSCEYKEVFVEVCS
jgi:hypothetical protein